VATSKGAQSGEDLHRLQQQHEKLCEQAASLSKRGTQAMALRDAYHRQREALETTLAGCEKQIEAASELGGSFSAKLFDTQARMFIQKDIL